MTDPAETGVRRRLALDADLAPSSVGLADRVRAASDAAGHRRRPVLVSVLAAAGVAVVVLTISLVAATRPTATPVLPVAPPVVPPALSVRVITPEPANPSTRPDFAACDTLAAPTDVLRVVTISEARAERSGLLVGFPHTGPVGVQLPRLSPSKPVTFCAIRRSTSGDLDAPGGELVVTQGDITQVVDRGTPAQVFADLQTTAAQLKKHHVQCLDCALPVALNCPLSTVTGGAPDTPAGIRVPDTMAAQLDQVRVQNCGSFVRWVYPGLTVTFDDGHTGDLLFANDPHSIRWQLLVGGAPTLVEHPVNGSFGVVQFVDGHGDRMTILGDGSIPADQLLQVLTSSTPIGDRTISSSD